MVLMIGAGLLGLAALSMLLMMCAIAFDHDYATEKCVQILAVSFALGIVLLGIGFLLEPASEKFELVVKDWTCTESHYETYTTFLLVGKVMVPQTHTQSVCDNFRRNGR